MKLAQVIAKSMMRLSSLPGMKFLQGYVLAARSVRTRYEQRRGDYEAYIGAGQGAAGEVRNAYGEPRQRGGAATDEDDEDQFSEYGYAYDYEYEYDDDGDAQAASDADDYPASDDQTSYFDDDYRSL